MYHKNYLAFKITEGSYFVSYSESFLRLTGLHLVDISCQQSEIFVNLKVHFILKRTLTDMSAKNHSVPREVKHLPGPSKTVYIF